MSKWDVVFWDDIGGPCAPSFANGAMGGSEYGLLLLARELSRSGLSVAVFSRIEREEWLEPRATCWFAPLDRITQVNDTWGGARALVVHRYSSIPHVTHDRGFVLATDVPDDRYSKCWPLLTERGGTLLCVSEWQASLFDKRVRKVVLPPPIPDAVYDRSIGRKNPNKYVFTSAPMKGWSQTIEMWREVKRRHRSFESAVLYGSCGWGDMKDPGMPDVKVLGRVPPRAQVAELDDAAGLFFVNAYPETFCVVAALAEARGCRVYALPTSDRGALPSTMAQKVLDSREEMIDRVVSDYLVPLPAPVFNDYRASHLVPRYADLFVGEQKTIVHVEHRTPTICLTMMVKNEGKVIADCLRSVRSIIDAYCIVVDPETTDDTREVIRRELDGVRGEIHEPKFEGFDKTRTIGIRLAEKMGTDYLITIDADDEFDGTLDKDSLGALDGYNVRVYDDQISYSRTCIFRARAGWYYKYPAHEVLVNERDAASVGFVSTLAYRRFRTSRPGNAKIERDIRVLEEALRKEPDEPRMTFYLAQSYETVGKHKKAIEIYKRRARLDGGNVEEKFVSLHRVGRILELSGAPAQEVELAYLRAWESWPTRCESLCHLSHYLSRRATEQEPHDRKMLARAYLYAKTAAATVRPADVTFVEDLWYVWGAKYQLALASIRIGRLREAREILEQMFARGLVPIEEQENARSNLRVCVENVGVDSGSAEQMFRTEFLEGNLGASDFFGTLTSMLKQAIAPGGSELGLGMTLFSLVVSTRARRVIEIGRFRGFSTIALAGGLRLLREGWEETSMAKARPDVDYARHESKEVMLVSIDPNPTEEARSRVESIGASEYVKFIDASSADAAAYVSGECDLLFVDGDHSFEGCWQDVLLYAPKLRVGGYMVLHDYFGWWGPNGENGSPIKKVCDMVVDTGEFEHVLIDTGYMSFMIFRKLEAP